MASDDHANLRSWFPGAVAAECRGDGWVEVTSAEGEEREGRCPVCARNEIREQVADFIPPRFREPIELPGAVTAWATMGASAQGLYLAGPVGTGKTHTAWAAVGAWCVQTATRPHGGGHREEYQGGGWYGPSVVFIRMTDLLDDLRPGDDSRQRVRDCQGARLLVLDDIGAEKASEWTQERLYSIIDHRYASCLPLIVTSNLPAKKLAPQTGERTASRLAEMCTVVAMTGSDRRKPAA